MTGALSSQLQTEHSSSSNRSMPRLSHRLQTNKPCQLPDAETPGEGKLALSELSMAVINLGRLPGVNNRNLVPLVWRESQDGDGLVSSELLSLTGRVLFSLRLYLQSCGWGSLSRSRWKFPT